MGPMTQRTPSVLSPAKKYIFKWLTVLLTTASIGGACGGQQRNGLVDVRMDGESEPRVSSAKNDVATPKRETEWLAILIDGHKTGYLKSTRTFADDSVSTEEITVMELQRGGTTNRIETISTVAETADGTPLGFEKRTEGSGMAQRIVGTVKPDGLLRITTEAGGAISSREIPWPKGSLMTEGQRLEALRHGLKTGVSYTSRYFDPDLLEAIEVTLTVGEKGPVDLFGRIVVGTEVFLTMDIRGTTLEMVMFVDDEMNTLKTVSTRMGLRVEMLACTEQYALSDNDPAEMIAASLIDAPVRLSKERRDRPISYTVAGLDAAARNAVAPTDEQRVTVTGDKLRVTVAKKPLPPGGRLPYSGADSAARNGLNATEWIQSNAEEIAALSKTAVGDAVDARTAALNIERFVAEYIEEKSFSVGYASALEVAKSRQGDCTEHALLTAALCRAAGIPADIVFGLVYVDEFEEKKGIFGGHAWTRVFLDGRWFSLDAALGGFDTGHIALTVSDGDPSDFFKIIGVVGNLIIEEID